MRVERLTSIARLLSKRAPLIVVAVLVFAWAATPPVSAGSVSARQSAAPSSVESGAPASLTCKVNTTNQSGAGLKWTAVSKGAGDEWVPPAPNPPQDVKSGGPGPEKGPSWASRDQGGRGCATEARFFYYGSRECSERFADRCFFTIGVTTRPRQGLDPQIDVKCNSSDDFIIPCVVNKQQLVNGTVTVDFKLCNFRVKGCPGRP